MVGSDLPGVPKYIAGFIEYKHIFNKEFKVEGNFANIFIKNKGRKLVTLVTSSSHFKGNW